MRSDVRRNRRLLIDAARELFRDRGDVPMYEIAKQAGVGQATLYRHFPDRGAIAAAVGRELLDRIEEVAPTEGGMEALEECLNLIVYDAVHYDIRPALVESGAMEFLLESRDRMTAVMAGPLEEARAAGDVRADVQPGDMLLIIQMIAGGMANAMGTQEQRTANGRRAMALVLHGICA